MNEHEISRLRNEVEYMAITVAAGLVLMGVLVTFYIGRAYVREQIEKRRSGA